MQAREQDHGGKERSEAGVQFLVQNLNEMGVRARVVSGPSGGKASVVEISGPVSARVWVKALGSASGLVPLSYKQEGWTFYGDLLVIATNIRLGEKTHPDAKIYAMSESEAKALADGGSFIPKSKFREWARRRAADEWRRKLRGVVG